MPCSRQNFTVGSFFVAIAKNSKFHSRGAGDLNWLENPFVIK